MDAPTLTLSEVSQMLRRRPETIRRKWRQLHRDHGFPRPLPGLGLVWSRALVSAWIEGGGATDERGGDARLVDRVRETLERRYVGNHHEEAPQISRIHPQRRMA